MGQVHQPEDAEQRPEARLGAALRAARQDQKISLRDMAARLNYSAHSNLVEYERGHRLAPLSVVRGYEDALNLPSGSLTRVYERVVDELRPSDESVPSVDVGPASPSSRRTVFAVTGVACLVTAVLVVLVLGPGGNGHPCSTGSGRGGYRALVGERGETFTSATACKEFVARGGAFAKGIVVPAGATATFFDVEVKGCNELTWGFELNLKETMDQGTKKDTCTGPGASFIVGPFQQPDVTIGPFPTAVLVRVYLRDVTCRFTFFSDGSHGLTTTESPLRIVIGDADVGCQAPPEISRVADNLALGLRIDPIRD